MSSEKIKRLFAVTRFSISEQIGIEKVKRIELAKRQLSWQIGDLIANEFDELPIKLLEKEIDIKTGAEEYRVEMCLADREYIKELEAKAQQWDMIQWAVDDQIGFVALIRGSGIWIEKVDIDCLEQLYKGRDE